MTIKDIAVCAFKLLGRSDIAAALSAGSELDNESAEKTEALVYCINAVEDELARYYFPAKWTEELQSADGKFYFTDFAHRPVKILAVMSDGKTVDFKEYSKYIYCGHKSITVEYEYSPEKRGLEYASAFDGTAVGEGLIACGAAAEYCVVAGSVQLAAYWEGRYRRGIELLRGRMRARCVMPPRRWV